MHSGLNKMLVIQSKIREYIKNSGDYNVASDVMEELSKKVEELLNDAITRTKGNGRKTIKGRDI